MRKPVERKAIDYASSAALRMIWRYRRGELGPGSMASLKPNSSAFKFMQTRASYARYTCAGVMYKYIHTCTNKDRVPLFAVCYTPDARRIFSGTHAGEITLWNGTQFNFETILSAHSAAIRTLSWTRDGMFLISGDNHGEIRYWLSNMNNLKIFKAHQEAVRDVSVSHNSAKLITASDDKTMKVIDFSTTHVDQVLEGHNADVRSAQWHRRHSLIVSSSKDGQGGSDLITLFQHRSAVNNAKWNPHDEFSFCSIGVDSLVFSYDIRNLTTALRTFRGHNKDVTSLQFHPVIPNYFVTGGSDGSISHWDLTRNHPLYFLEKAHDNIVWSIDFHPMGNVLISGGNDHHLKCFAATYPTGEQREEYS
ncbi:hypothetical protein GEMRC1_011583 [Eukaryota sp. GEM-RC1]